MRPSRGWRFPENPQLNRRLSAEFLFFLLGLSKTQSHELRIKALKNSDSLDIFKSNTLISFNILKDFLDTFDNSNRRVARKFLNRDAPLAPGRLPGSFLFVCGSSYSPIALFVRKRSMDPLEEKYGSCNPGNGLFVKT